MQLSAIFSKKKQKQQLILLTGGSATIIGILTMTGSK